MELYIRDCLLSDFPTRPDDDIIKELADNEILQSTDPAGVMPWAYVLCDVVAAMRRRYRSHRSTRYLKAALVSLLELDAMAHYEKETQSCGMLPRLAEPDENGRVSTWPFSHGLVDVILQNTSFWASARESPRMIRFLTASITARLGDVVQILVENGVDVHQRPEIGSLSPLEAICNAICTTGKRPKPEEISILEIILGHAREDRLNNVILADKGWGLLHCLANVDSEDVSDIATRLIQRGADPNLCVFHTPCWPAINFCLRMGNRRLARTLMENNADLTLSCDRGWDAALAASAYGAVDFLESMKLSTDGSRLIDELKRCCVWVRSAGSGGLLVDSPNALHLAAFRGHIDVMRFHLKRGNFNINSTSDYSLMPMHYAASAGHADVLSFIYNNGGQMQLNALDDAGRLPLHHAVMRQRPEAVKTLISLGSKQLADACGKTPSVYASNAEDLLTLLAVRAESENESEPEPVETQSEMSEDGVLPQPEHAARFREAIDKSDIAACEEAYQQGCDLDSTLPAHRNCTCPPLPRALRKRRPRVVVWLLREGASTASTSCGYHSNKTVLELCAQSQTMCSVLSSILDKRLRDGGEVTPDYLPHAIVPKNLRGLRIMLEHIKESLDQYG